MMSARGFKPEIKKMSKDEFESRHIGFLSELEDKDVFSILDQMVIFFKKKKKRILVYFYPLDTKLCQSDMTAIQQQSNKHKSALIIIAKNKPTPKVSSVLNILGTEAQFFEEKELEINITKHQLVPEHRLLSPDEREEIIRIYTTLPDKKQYPYLLPRMFSTYPVAKFYGLAVGDVVEVQRPRPDGFYDLSYRIVVPPITEKDKGKR